MNTKYIEKLEFNKILTILSDNCITNEGKLLAKNLHPENNKDVVLSILKETSEGTGLIYRNGSPTFFEIADFSYIEKILKSEACLNTKNLLDVLRDFEISFQFKKLLYY